MTHATLYIVRGLKALASFLRIEGPQIATRLTEVLREELKPGETVPDLGFLVELLLRRVVRMRDALTSTDRELRTALNFLHTARRLRDETADFLRDQLISARQILATSFTPRSTVGTDFRGRVSQDPGMAAKQAEFSPTSSLGRASGRCPSPESPPIPSGRRPSLCSPPPRTPRRRSKPSSTTSTLCGPPGST